MGTDQAWFEERQEVAMPQGPSEITSASMQSGLGEGLLDWIK